MGKRSDFPRKERDFYPTPLEAVKPLFPFLRRTRFIEPCVGDGSLNKHLKNFECVSIFTSDITGGIDARSYDYTADVKFYNMEIPNCFITNPPWDRDVLHPIIDNLKKQYPAWLLIDADWAYTKQSSVYMKYCRAMVAIGRVKWIPDSPHTGKENCAWYLFEKEPPEGTLFYGR